MSDVQIVTPDSPRVLVVDDEALIARLVMYLLEDAGIATKVIHSGEDAIEAIKAEPVGFQVLVTDIRLGHPPDGWAVAEAARRANPDIGVLYVTGDSMGDWPVKGVPRSLLLSKPFKIDEVLVAVKALTTCA